LHGTSSSHLVCSECLLCRAQELWPANTVPAGALECALTAGNTVGDGWVSTHSLRLILRYTAFFAKNWSLFQAILSKLPPLLPGKIVRDTHCLRTRCDIGFFAVRRCECQPPPDSSVSLAWRQARIRQQGGSVHSSQQLTEALFVSSYCEVVRDSSVAAAQDSARAGFRRLHDQSAEARGVFVLLLGGESEPTVSFGAFTNFVAQVSAPSASIGRSHMHWQIATATALSAQATAYHSVTVLPPPKC
jgi:hypothetical protein